MAFAKDNDFIGKKRMKRRGFVLAVGLTAALVLGGCATTPQQAMVIASPDPDAPDAPTVQISNGLVTAVLYLPDPERGYYRATRFDWSGAVADLRANGHSYFGRWFAKYDPNLHDSVPGPVQEYVTGQGFDAAPVGGTFVKIGVGVLRKPAEPIRGFPTLPIVDGGQWTTTTRPDAVQYTHVVDDPASGYGYRYTKVLSLTPGKMQMVLKHRLESTGRNPIDTQMYDHNFFMLDNEPSGPNIELRFPFTLEPFNVRGDIVQATANRLNYVRPLTEGSNRMQIKGFGPTAADYDIRVENRRTGAGVRVTSDQPLSDFVYWTSPTNASPEPYIRIRADRGQPMEWTITYDFYSLAQPAG
jgi:hypothetical protein